ncbi:MAG: hypothetical protein ACTSRO_02920 [Candidatus Heimdallarchaeaceae archaeon]
MPDLRISQKFKKRLSSNNHDFLVQLGITYTLFILSIVIRTLIRTWLLSAIDISAEIFADGSYSYANPEGYTWEIYPDATLYYQHYVYAFRYESWNPYALDRGFPLSGYVYGPIFVYSLVLLSFFISFFYPHVSRISIAWKTVVFAPTFFDSLTTVFIYLILVRKKDDGSREKKNILFSFLAAFSYILMPLVLFYSDTLYLNTYMFTFYTVVSFYFLTREKTNMSAFFLAIAVLTKLNSLFLVPLWFVYVFRNNPSKGFKFLLTVSISWIIFSLPWIVMEPSLYIGQQLWPGMPFNTVCSIKPQWIFWATTPAHTFLYWRLDNLGELYCRLNESYIPLIIFNLLSNFAVLLASPLMKKRQSSLFSFQAMFVIGSHLFLSRGNYKYYDAFFIPFAILAFAEWSQNFKKKSFGIPLFLVSTIWVWGVNILIITQTKWLHMFYVFLLFLTIILTYNKDLHFVFFKKENYTKMKVFFVEFFRNIFVRIQTVQKRFGEKRQELGKKGEKDF